jgi:hypothetical protein
MLLVVEGDMDAAIVARLLRHLSLPQPTNIVGRAGKERIVSNLDKYNNAAALMPVIVLLDLDNETCAPTYVDALLPARSLQLCMRVAVREIEAWLLADRDGIAQHLAVSRDLVPRDPESEQDPKRLVVNLAKRSRTRWIREEVAPRPGAKRLVGAAYVEHLLAFVHTKWDIDQSIANAASLERACRDLQRRLSS